MNQETLTRIPKEGPGFDYILLYEALIFSNIYLAFGVYQSKAHQDPRLCPSRLQPTKLHNKKPEGTKFTFVEYDGLKEELDNISYGIHLQDTTDLNSPSSFQQFMDPEAFHPTANSTPQEYVVDRWEITLDESRDKFIEKLKFDCLYNMEGLVYWYSSAELAILTTVDINQTLQAYHLVNFLQDKFLPYCDAHPEQCRPNIVWHIEYDFKLKRYVHYRAALDKAKYIRCEFTDDGMQEYDEADKYFHFVQKFPAVALDRSLVKTIEAYYVSSLAYGAGERVMNDRETVFPFTEQECQKLLDIYWYLKRGQDDREVMYNSRSRGAINVTLKWLTATVAIEVQKNRKEYKWGTFDARTHRDLPDTRFKMSKNLRMLDGVLAMLFFGMQSTYRKRLLSTRYKGKVHMPDFQKLIAGLLREWTDSNLLATVLVSANVAFLAVPNVLNLQKTASVASTIFGMVSILAGVHHNWRHRSHFDVEAEAHPRQGPNYDTADRYLRHLESRCGPELGVTIQACFLSLPVVLLLWAVVTFIIAISAFGIQKAEVSTRIVSISVLGVLTLIAVLNIAYFWRIWYEKEPYLDDDDDEEEEEEEEPTRNIFSTLKFKPDIALAREKFQNLHVKVVDMLRHRRPIRVKAATANDIELNDLTT